MKVEKSAVLISLVFCCSEEIRLLDSLLPRGMLAIFPSGLISFEFSVNKSFLRPGTAYAPAHCHSKGGFSSISQQTSVISSFRKSKSRCLGEPCELWHGRKMDAFQNRRSLQKTKVLAVSQRATCALTLIPEDSEMLLIISKLLQEPLGTPKQQLD